VSLATRSDPDCAESNGVCEHRACAAKPFCIVSELEQVKRHYGKSREDQFKIKVGA
jgi:hypothetical protein